MNLRTYKASFERDKTTVLRYIDRLRLSETAQDNHDANVWLKNYGNLLSIAAKELDGFLASSDFRAIDYGNVRTVDDLLTDYFTINGFKLDMSSLKAYINKYQKNKALITKELRIILPCIGVVLYHQIRLRINKIQRNSFNNKDDKELCRIILDLVDYQKNNWDEFIEEVSVVEKILRKDPAGLYENMDKYTKKTYQKVIQELANNTKVSEVKIAKTIIDLAQLNKNRQHVGFYLFDKEYVKQLRSCIAYRHSVYERVSGYISNRSRYVYFYAILSLFLLLSLILSRVSFNGWNGFLFFLFMLAPSVIASEAIVNFIAFRIKSPSRMYKMDYRNEIPDNAKTMLVIPTQIGGSSGEVDQLVCQLEDNYLNNSQSNIYFGLLLAFKDKLDKNAKATASELDNLEKLRNRINDLNVKYAHLDSNPKFFVFIRPRKWNEKEGMSIEWERKRGKIQEFNQLLRGGDTDFEKDNIDSKFMSTIKYVITIDQDDLLPKGEAERLISTIDHPLNRPVINQEKNIVQSGYGIVQPRTYAARSESPSLIEIMQNNEDGWGLYSSLTANVHQDLFGSSVYMGKGIYDVDVFSKVLYRRIPENVMLSHDHIEGSFLRVGFASDIVLLEDNPVSYSSYITRYLRWMRGDWQNIYWIRKYVCSQDMQKAINPISLGARLKLINNLIRALVYPAIVMSIILMTLGFIEFRLEYIYYMAFVFFIEPILSIFSTLGGLKITAAWIDDVRSLLSGFMSALLHVIFMITFAFNIAYMTIITLCKTLYRIIVSKRHLLEWAIFNKAGRSHNNILSEYLSKEFVYFEVFSLAMLISVVSIGSSIWIAFLYIFVALTPLWASLFSLTYSKKDTNILERKWFYGVALRSWRYFDERVSKVTNFLPPDSFRPGVSEKQSNLATPTNIGLYLSLLEAANMMNFISLKRYRHLAVELLNSMKRMQKHKGHFYNWYDAATLKAIEPDTISTVDNGNLVASLMAAEQSFASIDSKNICSKNYYETVKSMLNEIIELKSIGVANIQQKCRSVLGYLENTSINNVGDFYKSLLFIKEVNFKKLLASDKDVNYWIQKVESLNEDKIKEIELFYPWVVNNRLRSYSGLYQASSINILRHNIISHVSDKTIKKSDKKLLEAALNSINETIEWSYSMARKCENIYREIDYSFLYDRTQELFYIGHVVSTGATDTNHFDSFLSETRLCSFTAIANNNVYVDHWAKLMRPLAAYKGRVFMMSWSGSLFEYLFSQLYMNTTKNSFLEKVYAMAIKIQINFAKKHRIPWGISESCSAKINESGDFVYAPHGVPLLGVKPDMKKSLVVSPYSSALALTMEPRKVFENLKNLKGDGAYGDYGFYEAIDYESGDPVPIKIYYAHHQAIIILSIYNYISSGGVQTAFSNSPRIRTMDYILDEKVFDRRSIRSIKEVSA